jgi:O-antigen/teichoic acid export membrane protein
MILATVVLNLSMVAYQRVMSIGLGDKFAELSALGALINLLGVVMMGASTTLVKIFAEDAAEIGSGAARGRFHSLTWPMLKAMLAASLVFLALAHPVIGYLKLDSWVPYALVSSVFVINFSLLSSRAAVQGTQRFGHLGTSIALEGLGRLGLGALFVGLGLGVAGALGASLLAMFIGMGFSYAGIRTLGQPEAFPRRDLAGGVKEMAKDATVLGLFSVICYMDVLVAKHQMPDALASGYSRASIVAKSFLYLGSALNMVLLPTISSALARGAMGEAKKDLLKFLGWGLALDLAGLAFVWGLTPLVIRILCGAEEGFQALAPLIRSFSAAVIPLALAQLVLFYLLAAREYRTLWLLLAVTTLYALLLQHAQGDAQAVVQSLGLCALLLLGGCLWLAFSPGRRREGA